MSMDYEQLYRTNAPRTERVARRWYDKLQNIVDDAQTDADTDSYLLLMVPYFSEEEGAQIIELANALQRRIFMNAPNVVMRSTLIPTPTGDKYSATLVIKKKGADVLHHLYGNSYATADMRQTEAQCATLFESEFGLLARRIAENALPEEAPPEQESVGVTTVFFVETNRGHENAFRVTPSPPPSPRRRA